MAAITTDTVVRRDFTVVRDESFVEETVKQPTDTEELSELEKNIRKAERIRHVTDQYKCQKVSMYAHWSSFQRYLLKHQHY